MLSLIQNFPNLSFYGYSINELLGQNLNCGQRTFKAIDLNTGNLVVIKQFAFISEVNSWAGYKAIVKEIDILKTLEHPNIPKYLTSFESEQGFCLVQEYINAQPLDDYLDLTMEVIQDIATQVLEILCYLQSQQKTIIHRDIKPSNLLFSENENKVYLIDFGISSISSSEIGEMGYSTMFAGTYYFMPPEVLYNRLNKASDLYSLGITLVCLITGTKNSDLERLADESFLLNYRQHCQEVNWQFHDWLARMIAPDLNKRFKNAPEALEALGCINKKQD